VTIEYFDFAASHFINDSKRPYYAILSHSWGVKEILFQDIQGSHDKIKTKAGHVKVQRCCAQAASGGFEYVWIGTCCIEKMNSAELSEAINSMFRWYRDAVECFAYLVDVGSIESTCDTESCQTFYAFEDSPWFTRGWTLQVLLAPSTLLFFNSDGQELETRASLHSEITRCTSIPSSALLPNNKGIE
jgi:hypothetical protein